jgi:hypothetical protein
MNPSYATLPRALLAGACAAGLSTVALLLRGRQDAGSALVPLNAPSHWIHGTEALHQPHASWRYTAPGVVIHHASALMWGFLFDRVLGNGLVQKPAKLAAKAAVVTGVAAWVDLKLVPERLTPGFEHSLSRKSLLWTYGAFAGGLALGAMAWRQSR